MKNTSAQKFIPLVAPVFGLIFPVLSIIFYYRGGLLISFVLLLLGLVCLGYTALKNTTILGVAAYILMFVIFIFTTYIFGLGYLRRAVPTLALEKSYIFRTILLTALFGGFSHYLIHVGTKKRIAAIIATVLMILLVGFIFLTPVSFVANLKLAKFVLILLGLSAVGLFFVKGKRAKVAGIVGLIISILLFGASCMFMNSAVYTLKGENLETAVTAADKILDDAFDAYNTDITSFSSYFTKKGVQRAQDTYEDLQEEYGDYVSRGDPEAYYASGCYFIFYPTEFSNKSNRRWAMVGVKDTGTGIRLHVFDIFDNKPDF